MDVLCSHVPPDVPMMRYDVVPGRLEMAGPGLREHIDTQRPALALSGHVHQPLAARIRRGRTECVNVGHFQRTGEPYTFELDDDPAPDPDVSLVWSRRYRERVGSLPPWPNRLPSP